MDTKYYRDHLINILQNEDIDKYVLIDCLTHVLENSILDRSTEDLEYRLTQETKE